MIRRSHKKSRQGCAECKQSRKKCDESRPACVNCTTAKKRCSYTRKASSQSPNNIDFVLSPGNSDLARSKSPHLSAASHTTDSSPQLEISTPTPPGPEPYVNLLHLELFQNVAIGAISFFDDHIPKEQWIATVLRYSFTYTYLMYEVLALSAFHLSFKYPSKSDLYLAESTALQAHALSLFNSSNTAANQDHLIPAFLFSSILGMHFFCDTFSTRSPDLHSFLNRLVQSIRLLRGVRTMIGNSWEFIKNSDIKCLLQAEDGEPVDRNDEVTRAFEDLRTKFSQSHTLSAFESKVYCEAITGLTRVYNSQPTYSPAKGPKNTRMVTDWPITISAEYTELLNERKPEALVIIAYFSTLLHRTKGFWAVGDAGRLLLSAIEEYLGEEWVEWLVVPRGLFRDCSLDLKPSASI